MNRQNGENPEGKYIWYDEVANTDKTEPQYQLNPLTKKQDALMHRKIWRTRTRRKKAPPTARLRARRDPRPIAQLLRHLTHARRIPKQRKKGSNQTAKGKRMTTVSLFYSQMVVSAKRITLIPKVRYILIYCYIGFIFIFFMNITIVVFFS